MSSEPRHESSSELSARWYSSLPTNAVMRAYANEVAWGLIEEVRVQFQEYLSSIRDKRGSHPVSTAMLKHLTQGYFDDGDGAPDGNVLLSRGKSRPVVLGTLLGRRFQQGPWLDYIRPYNLNPAVNHENLHQAGGQLALRPVGSELEVGLARADGYEPTESDLDRFHQAYFGHAARLGSALDLAPELCVYQSELVMPPVFGYAKSLRTLETNISALTHATHEAGMLLSIVSVYPYETDFATSHTNKVETVAIFLNDVNESRPNQCRILEGLRERYKVRRGEGRTANLLRFQGYHLHVDLAGRSEALGLVSYMLNLGSASAVANAALLKGGPFVDGVCDPDLLCAREYVRSISITGHYVGVPLTPHLLESGMDRHAHLLRANLANGTARALLYGEEDDAPYSGMHNMLGRVRPDLGASSRVCTLESTGMPANPSAERLAAVANDFQLSQLAIEHYFRRFGSDLEGYTSDKEFWEIFGPLDREVFHEMIRASDHLCTDLTVVTAAGTKLSLVDFYEKKRRVLKRILGGLNVIDTRDIDTLYDYIYHFLAAPNGGAETIDDYINHPTRRGTGNWGRILKNAFIAKGGTPGEKQPEIVTAVMTDLHHAMVRRYVG